ncbi:MAG: arylsulfotransferase family protein, partial [Gaiella sp.]
CTARHETGDGIREGWLNGAMLRQGSTALTRRGFLGVTGVAVAAALAPPGLAAPSASARARRRLDDVPVAHSFVSRPDLRPPVVDVLRADTSPVGGHLFLCPFTLPNAPAGEDAGALIVDARGTPLWFRPLSPALHMDLKVQRLRGKPVLTWWAGTVFGGYGGSFAIADASYRIVGRVRAGNGYLADLHDIVLTSRGTALITIYNEVKADLTSIGGSVEGRLVEGIVQEIELRSGRVLFEWHSLDHVALEESSELRPTQDGNVDYFHLNSIGVDGDGHLLLSARHTSAVYKIHRRTGKVMWRLGGTRSDFALGPGVAFGYQHDARRREDGTITLFDNAASLPTATEPPSRAIRLRLDERARRATLVREYRTPDTRVAWAMGNAQQLRDQGLLVGWGMHPAVTELDRRGRVRFDARFRGRSVSYRAFRSPWVGRPAAPPDLALVRASTGVPAAYASWNGATEVAGWQVLAGTRRTDLRPVKTVRARGFETAIALPSLPAFARVTALDRAGAVLGSSPIVAT